MSKEIIRVSPWHLRRLFRRGKFQAKVQSGELVADRIKHKHLTREKALQQKQPYCTHSQTFDYVLGTRTVATVHQYLAPDGISLGGSGHPDPKYIEMDGLIYGAWVKDTWYKKIWYWLLGWLAGIRYKLLG